MFRQISSRIRLPRNTRDLSHAANLRHGTDGFTSPPKEGVLRIFLLVITSDTFLDYNVCKHIIRFWPCASLKAPHNQNKNNKTNITHLISFQNTVVTLQILYRYLNNTLKIKKGISNRV
jgi:hypothetical protein